MRAAVEFLICDDYDDAGHMRGNDVGVFRMPRGVRETGRDLKHV